MPRAGFEPTIPTTKQPQTYALDRATTGIDPTYYPGIKPGSSEKESSD
jgi:hypothetical protein